MKAAKDNKITRRKFVKKKGTAMAGYRIVSPMSGDILKR